MIWAVHFQQGNRRMDEASGYPWSGEAGPGTTGSGTLWTTCTTGQGSLGLRCRARWGKTAEQMMPSRRDPDQDPRGLRPCALPRGPLLLPYMLFSGRIGSFFAFPRNDICRFGRSRPKAHEGWHCSVVQGIGAGRWGASSSWFAKASAQDCSALIVGLRASARGGVWWSSGR
jgi:hypothetical protein